MEKMSASEFDKTILPLKDRIYQLAKSILCDSYEAEDTVQDMFLKFWNVRDNLSGFDNIEAYVFRAVKNNCIDKIRKRRNSPHDDLSAVKAENAGEASRTEITDMRKLAERVIASLPHKQRAIMHMRDVEGYEFDEIARVMEIDETAVRVNLSRARKTVRDKMIKIVDYGVR